MTHYRIPLLLWFVMLPAAFAAAPPTRPKPPAGDAVLEKAIRDRFARSKIAVDGFTVHVQGGVATLEGKTAVIQHKGTATRLAHAAGAAQVANKIQISEEARQRASANLAKGRRRVQVKRSERDAQRSERPPGAPR